jgi:hypothetical protein
MNTIKKLCLGVSAIAALTIGAASASPEDNILSDEATSVSQGAAIAGAKRATPEASLAAHLSGKGKNSATAASLVKTADWVAADGKRFARFEQRIGGLRVYGGFARTAFDASGAPIQIMDRVADASLRVAKAGITDKEALAIAIGKHHGASVAAPGFVKKTGATSEFAKSDFFYAAPTVERVVVARGQGRLEEGFFVETWGAKDNLLHHTVVDAVGKIVHEELRTNTDSYRIFPNSPGVSGQTIVNGPGSTTESPNGWLNAGSHQSIRIQGNNADAYLDRDDSETPDAGGSTITDGNFLATWSSSADPDTTTGHDVGVQNLFYVTNRIHDILYRAGFNEAAGNFQTNNFGLGGAGNDPVNAEAQDGQGTDNANFATPSDGSRPRMQMYIWTRSTPRRDGDLDTDIIYHEYGHGLTWRMIGSMGGTISGAIGEGMGDTLAFIINNDPALAEWSYNRAAGLRSVSADQQNETMNAFRRSRGVHRNGEIFGATMWDVWTEYKNAGHNADTALADFVGGMNFIAPDPNFLKMRDGFLQQAPSTRDCLIWRGFASHGMGVGATQGKTGTGTESYAVPSGC